MQWAHRAHPQGRPDRAQPRAIAVTLVLGVIFLCSSCTTTTTLITHDDFGINSGVYGTLFYTMTGFHGAHVLGGVIGLAVILARAPPGQFSARHHVAVEAVNAYWHFVDVVWVALFPTIYLLQVGGTACSPGAARSSWASSSSSSASLYLVVQGDGDSSTGRASSMLIVLGRGDGVRVRGPAARFPGALSGATPRTP